MTGTLRIEWTSIESMLANMVDVGLEAGEIDDYFQEHVVNTQGLDYPTCALKPIGDLLPELGSAFAQTRSYYQQRWVEVIEAIAQSAAEIDSTDHQIDIAFDQYTGDLDSMPEVTISVKAFEPKDLAGLEAPGEGEPKLKHNDTWETTSSGYDATRDGINGAIEFINGLGVPGVTLPAQAMSDSLETMREIRDMVDQLPSINADGGIGSMPPVNLPGVETQLGQITVEVTTGGDEEDSLDDRLDDLEGQTEEEGDDADEGDDDGPIIMAPGPLEPPYGPGTPSLPMA